MFINTCSPLKIYRTDSVFLKGPSHKKFVLIGMSQVPKRTIQIEYTIEYVVVTRNKSKDDYHDTDARRKLSLSQIYKLAE